MADLMDKATQEELKTIFSQMQKSGRMTLSHCRSTSAELSLSSSLKGDARCGHWTLIIDMRALW